MIKNGIYNNDDRLQKIYAFNLSYLLLARSLIQQDFETAGFYLGIDEELITPLKMLLLPDMLRMASMDRLICQLRFDNKSIINVLTRSSRLEALQGIHTGIILSTGLLHDRVNVAQPDVSSKRRVRSMQPDRISPDAL